MLMQEIWDLFKLSEENSSFFNAQFLNQADGLCFWEIWAWNWILCWWFLVGGQNPLMYILTMMFSPSWRGHKQYLNWFSHKSTNIICFQGNMHFGTRTRKKEVDSGPKKRRKVHCLQNPWNMNLPPLIFQYPFGISNKSATASTDGSKVKWSWVCTI